jgi:hypothetical protein
VPFVASRPLADMLNPDAAGAFLARAGDAAGDRLLAETKRGTPVDSNPWHDHVGRLPGTLRESVQRGPVERHRGVLGSGIRVRVFTEDRVAPFVEESTRPHEIRPCNAGMLSFRVAPDGRRVYAHVVHHPGTRGAHMFAIAALILEGELGEVLAEPLRLFAEELTKPSHRIIDRRVVA